MDWDGVLLECIGLGWLFLECLGGWGILVVEETDNLECMKKSTIIGGNKYILDYEHGCLTTALRIADG